ncbi:MAG: hypothetical protein DMG96_35440 [Acidobacteria bacterium]|nr:MAG: hypothetical protein DMG96_35440 [Acidobacteriota bacterium]
MTPEMDKVDEIESRKRGRTPRRDRQSGFQFKSSLLKRSFIDMHETPTMLPPRNDLRRHLDTEVKDEVMEGVMDGVTEPESAQKKPSRPKQIDPRINPNGVSNWDPMLMTAPGSTIPVSVPQRKWARFYRSARQLEAVAFPPNTPTGQYGEVKRPAPKPKRKPTEKPAESERNAMDQVHDAEAEAYQAFLNQDYLQQEAMERNIDMRELWNEMKNEFMAQYFQMPYTQKR